MDEKKRICLVYNFAQHYREEIFLLMDKHFDIDFVFGDRYLDVKKMDCEKLSSYKEVKNINIMNTSLYYQKGVLATLNKGYSAYIMLGDFNCISTWLMLVFAKLKK